MKINGRPQIPDFACVESNIRLMMMMMISGWISLGYLIDNYATNHASNFLSLPPPFSAGYRKFRRTNCFHNGKKEDKINSNEKITENFVLCLYPKSKVTIRILHIGGIFTLQFE